MLSSSLGVDLLNAGLVLLVLVHMDFSGAACPNGLVFVDIVVVVVDFAVAVAVAVAVVVVSVVVAVVVVVVIVVVVVCWPCDPCAVPYGLLRVACPNELVVVVGVAILVVRVVFLFLCAVRQVSEWVSCWQHSRLQACLLHAGLVMLSLHACNGAWRGLAVSMKVNLH